MTYLLTFVYLLLAAILNFRAFTYNLQFAVNINLEYFFFKTSNVEPLTSSCGLGFEV
jgi:hypothetical protein